MQHGWDRADSEGGEKGDQGEAWNLICPLYITQSKLICAQKPEKQFNSLYHSNYLGFKPLEVGKICAVCLLYVVGLMIPFAVAGLR